MESNRTGGTFMGGGNDGRLTSTQEFIDALRDRERHKCNDELMMQRRLKLLENRGDKEVEIKIPSEAQNETFTRIAPESATRDTFYFPGDIKSPPTELFSDGSDQESTESRRKHSPFFDRHWFGKSVRKDYTNTGKTSRERCNE